MCCKIRSRGNFVVKPSNDSRCLKGTLNIEKKPTNDMQLVNIGDLFLVVM